MKADIIDSPVLDEDGDMWLSRRWLAEHGETLRPVEFMYLTWKLAGLRVGRLRISETTVRRVRKSLAGKGLL